MTQRADLPPLEIPERPALLRNVVHFARALRRLGVETTPTQVEALLDAVDWVDLRDRARFRATARCVLVSRREHLATFDRLFDLFWSRDAERPRQEIDLGLQLRRRVEQKRREALALDRDSSAGGDLPEVESDVIEPTIAPSDQEILRHKDFAELSDDERRQVTALLLRQPLRWPPRRTRRGIPARRGTVDLRRTIRKSLARGGEPVELLHRRRKLRPRPIVALLDVSGSMEAYARILLQWLYTLRVATDRLEVFVFGTRLTRLTRELRGRDVDRALREATARVRDWGGGTRIGESFRRFNFDWARRVLGRGSVVLVLSDAWDRGEPEFLECETARLARHASRLMWLNPLLGSTGYEPTAAGISAVLPHVDDFLPVHDLHSLERLAEVLEELGGPLRSSRRSVARPRPRILP